jgi:hypothetical protein
LLVVGVLMLALLVYSLVGATTAVWLIAAGLVVAGVVAGLSRRIL